LTGDRRDPRQRQVGVASSLVFRSIVIDGELAQRTKSRHDG